MRRSIVIILLALSAGSLCAQWTAFNWEDHSMYRRNNFYWYSCYPTVHPYWVTGKFDTLNYCRIRKSHIRSVTVFRVKAGHDSIPVTTITYDTSGVTRIERRLVSDSVIRCISCDSVQAKRYRPNQRMVKRAYGMEEIKITNALGYVCEYRSEHYGFFKRYMMEWTEPDVKWEYHYSNDYRTATALYSEKDRFSMVDYWTPLYKYVYTLDDKDNLVTAYTYKLTGSGDYVLSQGFNYVYEYY